MLHNNFVFTAVSGFGQQPACGSTQTSAIRGGIPLGKIPHIINHTSSVLRVVLHSLEKYGMSFQDFPGLEYYGKYVYGETRLIPHPIVLILCLAFCSF